jgi:hypothetical protein
MEQSPSGEADRFSASQEIPRIFGTRRVHYSSHNCPPPVTILSQLDPVHTPHLTSWRIHLNIILPSRLDLPSGIIPSAFTTKTLYTPLHSPIRTTLYAHLILFDFITRTILGEQYKSLSSSLCSFLHSRHLVRLKPKYSPQHPILKHPQSSFLPQCMRPSFTLIHHNTH